MGYDLHITRALDWTANRGAEIPKDEWLALIAADRELVADPANGDCAVRWRQTAWFDWFEGNVFTTDPDRPAVAKMIDLAHVLGGIVQGDRGEIYESARQWQEQPPPAART